MLPIVAAVRVHDDVRTERHRESRHDDLSDVAGTAREVDVHDVWMLAQLPCQLPERLRKRYCLRPLTAFHHRRDVSGMDLVRQRIQQQPFDAGHAAANIQPRTDHYDIGVTHGSPPGANPTTIDMRSACPPTRMFVVLGTGPPRPSESSAHDRCEVGPTDSASGAAALRQR